MVTIESSGTQQKAIVHDEKQWLNSGKQQYIVEEMLNERDQWRCSPKE